MEIPGLANPSEDGSGIDLSGAFDAVRRAIAAAGLRFRVEESVHLSILQFAKFRLWKDVDEAWKTLSYNSLVAHLIETPLEVEDVLTAMDSHRGGAGAICCHPADGAVFSERWATLATIVIEPARAEMRVSAGGPCQRAEASTAKAPAKQ